MSTTPEPECGYEWMSTDTLGPSGPHTCIRPVAFHDLYDHKCVCGTVNRHAPVITDKRHEESS